MPIRCALAALFVLALLAGCATRRDVTTIDSRVNQMELRDAEDRRRQEEFAKMRESNDQALRQQAATLRAQIDELREEVRDVTGRLEEMQHAQRQAQASGEPADRRPEDRLSRLEDASTLTNQRLARIEQQLKLEPLPAVPKSDKTRPESPTAKVPTEEEFYNRAKLSFDQGNMPQARKGFEDLIKAYPGSDNADNAQFWIGETYYREKAFEKSILEYQKVIEKYPKGNKVPAALLKQGYAFLSLGDKVNSRLIFEELVRKYPKSSEAKAAADKLKEMR
jgi:tol-pal system protein YbgF